MRTIRGDGKQRRKMIHRMGWKVKFMRIPARVKARLTKVPRVQLKIGQHNRARQLAWNMYHDGLI